jgi:hypothetical protein
MQGKDYIDSTSTLRSTWITEDGERRYVPYDPAMSPKVLKKKIDELLDENSKLTSRLLTLRTIVERGLDCNFTYERINKPFGIGQMSGECIDAYNTLQQIMKEYDKMFNGCHVTDKNKDWEAQ